MKPENSTNRIKALDGLRTFAIIFVLLSHSLWRYKEYVTFKIGFIELNSFLYNGWFGVDLFFVLSGFLIATQLLKKP